VKSFVHSQIILAITILLRQPLFFNTLAFRTQFFISVVRHRQPSHQLSEEPYPSRRFASRITIQPIYHHNSFANTPVFAQVRFESDIHQRRQVSVLWLQPPPEKPRSRQFLGKRHVWRLFAGLDDDLSRDGLRSKRHAAVCIAGNLADGRTDTKRPGISLFRPTRTNGLPPVKDKLANK